MTSQPVHRYSQGLLADFQHVTADLTVNVTVDLTACYLPPRPPHLAAIFALTNATVSSRPSCTLLMVPTGLPMNPCGAPL
jgi:hypothetical protein